MDFLRFRHQDLALKLRLHRKLGTNGQLKSYDLKLRSKATTTKQLTLRTFRLSGERKARAARCNRNISHTQTVVKLSLDIKQCGGLTL